MIEFIPEIDVYDDHYEVWVSNLRYSDRKPRAKELIQFCRPSTTVVPYICVKDPVVWTALFLHLRRMGYDKVKVCYSGRNCRVVEL
jgi:hypothetical protein